MQATTTVSARESSARRRAAGAAWVVLAVQFYAAATYLVTTVGQYLLAAGRPWLSYALSADGAANPISLLVVVPGYYITLLSGPVFALLALWGAAVAAARWAALPGPARAWSAAGVALCAALFIFGLTPLGHDMAVGVAG